MIGLLADRTYNQSGQFEAAAGTVRQPGSNALAQTRHREAHPFEGALASPFGDQRDEFWQGQNVVDRRQLPQAVCQVLVLHPFSITILLGDSEKQAASSTPGAPAT